MFNPSSFLTNAKLDLYRVSDLVNNRGGKSNINTLIKSGINANIQDKVEMSEVVPQQNIGGLYMKDYIISVWQNIDFRDGDLLLDSASNKFYKVLSVETGSLYKLKSFKVQLHCIVMGDSRYLNFEQPI